MSEKSSFLEDLQNEKPESFGEEVFTKRQRNFYPMIIGGTAVTIILIFIIILLNLGVKAPDMKGWTEGEVFNWGKDNGITIIKTLVYDEEIANGILFAQDIPAEKRVRKSTPFPVTISQGPDPNAVISMIDIKSTNEDNIKAWIDANKLTGVTLRYETNEVISKGTVIEYTLVDGTESNFLRKNRINIFISSGPEVISDTVTVPNFAGNQKSSVVQWGNKNSIEIIFTEAFDEYIVLGHVVSQSIKADTKITREDSVEIVLSLGIPIEVPDFYGMERLDAVELANRYGITLYYEQQVYAGEPDKVLDQDIIGGSQIAKNQPVTLTISRESDEVKVPQFVGLTHSEASTLAGLNNIRIFVITVESTEESELVIGQDISAGQMVLNTGYVTLKISSGDLIVPDFVGLSKSTTEAMAQANGLTLVYNPVPSTDYENETIIGQNFPADTKIEKGGSIILDVATNTGVKAPNLTTISKEEAELWATRNQVTITFFDRYDNTHPYGTLFDQNLVGSLLPDANSLVIYRSLGKVPVEDFIGKTRLDVEAWINQVNTQGADIKLYYIEVENSKESPNTVLNQSKKLELVATSTIIEIYVAKAKSVVVPNFSNMTKTEVITWGTLNGVPLTIIDRYSSTIASGKLYDQSVTGTLPSVLDGVTVYHSLGFVIVPDFTGQDKSQVEDWIASANEKGASLLAIYMTTSSSQYGMNQVFAQSTRLIPIDLNTSITFYVVNQTYTEAPVIEKTVIPLKDFTGVTYSNFENWCLENNVDIGSHVIIRSGHHNTLASDLMYGQSLTGTMILETQKLEIYRSIGPVKVGVDSANNEFDIIGKSVSVFKGALNTWNLNNANLKVTYKNLSGTVIASPNDNHYVHKIDNHDNQNISFQISTGTTIIITIADSPPGP